MSKLHDYGNAAHVGIKYTFTSEKKQHLSQPASS